MNDTQQNKDDNKYVSMTLLHIKMVLSRSLIHGAYQDTDVMEQNRRISTNAVMHKRKPIVLNTNRFIDDALYYDGTYTHT